MEDLEKSHADSAARSHESYKKDLEKNCWNETGLASLMNQTLFSFYLDGKKGLV